jgi:hypothetical protein
MSDEHKDKAVGKTLANFGNFVEEKIGEFLVEHKTVWNTLADFGDFLEKHKKIIMVVVGTSLLWGFFDGWEMIQLAIRASIVLALGASIVLVRIAGLDSRIIRKFFKWWGVVYCVLLGVYILAKLYIIIKY